MSKFLNADDNDDENEDAKAVVIPQVLSELKYRGIQK